MDKLPKVITTSVIRSSNKGESHGGLYLVDLESSELTQIIDWNETDINWEGRGMDRGMRGIAFYKKNIYIAISDEILVYNSAFEKVDSIKNMYLRHCHEIYIKGDKLYLTSTGFDTILEYDLINRRFVRGYALRYTLLNQYLNRFNIRNKLESNWLCRVPRLTIFNPNGDAGPDPGDYLHINNVFADDDNLFVCGTKLGRLLKINGKVVSAYALVPYSTHNARPFNGGVLANYTRQNKISFFSRNKEELSFCKIPLYDENKLLNNELPKDYARQGFGRGLCCYKDLIIAGSSPATISVYRRGNYDPIKTVNISMDIRNAIHGLEVWEL